MLEKVFFAVKVRNGVFIPGFFFLDNGISSFSTIESLEREHGDVLKKNKEKILGIYAIEPERYFPEPYNLTEISVREEFKRGRKQEYDNIVWLIAKGVGTTVLHLHTIHESNSRVEEVAVHHPLLTPQPPYGERDANNRIIARDRYGKPMHRWDPVSGRWELLYDPL